MKIIARQAVLLLPNLFRLLYRLVRDHRIPGMDKAIFLAALLYLLFPLDLLPDLIPLAGQVDDFILVALGLQRLLNAAGPEIIGQHWGGNPGRLRLLQRVLDAILFFLPASVKGKPPQKSRDKDIIDVEYRIKE